MRRYLFAVVLALAPFIVGWTATWQLPTKYVDNTAITAAKIQTVKVKLYMDNTLLFTTAAGATSYAGAGYFGQKLSASALLDGVEGPRGAQVTIPFGTPEAVDLQVVP